MVHQRRAVNSRDAATRRVLADILFGKDTTDFAPQTDRGSLDGPTLPVLPRRQPLRD